MRKLIRVRPNFPMPSNWFVKLDHSCQLFAAIVMGSLLGGGLMALHQSMGSEAAGYLCERPRTDSVYSNTDRAELKALIEEVITSGNH